MKTLTKALLGATTAMMLAQLLEGQKDSKMKVPDAFEEGKFQAPTMFTTDLSLRFDPEFEKISRNLTWYRQGYIEELFVNNLKNFLIYHHF